LIGLAIAAFEKVRFQGALYLAAALPWTIMIFKIYLREGFGPDGHGCENCWAIVVQFILNVAWLFVVFPIGMLIWAYRAHREARKA
jgi:hypothetical protein